MDKNSLRIKNVDGNLYIFLTKQAKNLSQRAIQYRLKFWAKKQGISENIHPSTSTQFCFAPITIKSRLKGCSKIIRS